MLQIGVLASGGGTNFQAVADAVARGEVPAQITLVISNNTNAFVLERAKKLGIETMVCRKKDYASIEAYEDVIINAFQARGVGLVLMAGCMVVFTERLIRAFPNRILNIHPALIPAFSGKGYYGLRVHEAALAKGVKITGATVHFVDEGTDTGAIILQKAVEVKDGDTPETLQRRVMEEAEWVILPEAVRLFAADRLVVEGNRVRVLPEEETNTVSY